MSSLSGDAHSPLLCGTQVLDLTSHVSYLIFQTLWWEDMRWFKSKETPEITTLLQWLIKMRNETKRHAHSVWSCVVSKTNPFTVTMSYNKIFGFRRKRNSAWCNKINQSRLDSPTLPFKHTYLGMIRTMCKGLLEESAVVVSSCALSHLTEAWH